jgi:tRNA(Arg) A34 adenosine deaminase TadA
MSDDDRIAVGYSVTIPEWVQQEVDLAGAVLATSEDRMRLVNTLAARNFRDGGGGPFAALVVESESGRVVSAGVNRVLASNLSAAHAEVVALSLAQTRLGRWDLGASGSPATELVVNWRPCAQCYGALLWSGVTRVVIAGSGPELEQLTGFDEGPVRDDWAEQLESRGVALERDVLREEALAVYRDYGEYVGRGDVVVYNARGTGAIDH